MILGFLPVLAGLIALFLALLVVAGGAGAKNTKWPFVLFGISVAAWSIGVGVFSITQSQNTAALLVPAYYIAALFIAFGLLQFCIAYSGKKVAPWVMLLSAVPLLAVSVLVAIPGMFIDQIDTGTHSVQLDSMSYILYSALFVAYTIIALGLLWHRAAQKTRTRHYRLLAIGLTVCLLGGGFFNLLLPGLGTYNYILLGPLFTFIMVATVFYAIARHGLFDIRLAVVRTVTYILSLGTLAAIYLVVAYIVFNTILNQTSSVSQIAVNVVLTLVLAFIFQPVRRFFDRLTNKIFYQDNYSAGDFLAELSRELTSTTDLRELLQRASNKITQTLKVTDVSFVVYTKPGHSEQVGVGKYKKISYKDARWLDERPEVSAEVLVLPLLTDESEDIRRMMVSHRVTIILPLIHQKEMLGYLFLGEHKRQGYSARDVRVVRALGDELVIAIQNALSVDEIRELNAHLEQRIDNATKELRASNAQLQKLDEAKDEFISMASHQLRTPLTSIKGYISMLIEGDIGSVTPEQKHVLNEAFISSERMVRLIGDFLNVSRLQTGKFVIEKRPVDLAQLVKDEIESLGPNAAPRGLKFIYKAPKNIPELEIDENKIQQVIMNFSDNAIYYSKDNSKITVSLQKVDGFVEFRVKDSGIGVPLAEQEQLFSKFFRATNARKARPDGTGVGLFLAKKVIDDHGGQMIFESVEGKGSTFGFRLPLPKK